jgi:uncharacterized protein YecT (DUF1311 family)
MRFNPFPLLALTYLVSQVSPVQAQDEIELTREQEKSAFQSADKALNAAYQKAKKTLTEWDFKALQEDQREWLQFRDAASMSSAVYDDGPEFEEREEASTAYWRTMKFVTQTRTRMVEGWTNESDRELKWEGEWTDGYGGWLRIAKEADAGDFRFDIEVVRGPTYHLGMIDGEARVNDSMAFFSDAGSDEKADGDPETWLIFEKNYSAPQLQLSGVNTQYYHGMRAYFTGTYTRVGDLDASARKEVLTGARLESE